MGFLRKRIKNVGKKVAKKMANTIGGPTNKNTGKRTVSIMGKKTGLGGLLKGRKPIKPQGGGKTIGGGLGLGRPKGPMKPRSRGMITPTARGIKPMQGVKMFAGGGDVIAGSTQNRRAMQGAVVAKSGVKKMKVGGALKKTTDNKSKHKALGKQGGAKLAQKMAPKKLMGGGLAKSGVKKLGRGGKLKK